MQGSLLPRINIFLIYYIFYNLFITGTEIKS
jgi:hypothetical protein